MPTIAAFLNEHRAKILAAIGVFALMAFSFGLGRTTAAKTVEIQTVEVEKVVYKDRIVMQEIDVSKKNEATNDKSKKTIVKKERISPDGTVERTETVEDAKNVETVRTEIKYVDRIVEKIVEVEKEVEKKVLVKEAVTAPDWRIGLSAGVMPIVSTQRLVEGQASFEDFVIGVHAERRLLGPLFGGLRIDTQKTVGVSLTLEF